MAKKKTSRKVKQDQPRKKADIQDIEDDLWGAADQLRANSGLKASEYSAPVLGLIFLRFADARFTQARAELEKLSTGRRKISKTDYQARGALYVPEQARYSYLLDLPEKEDLGKAVNDAMKSIEAENENLGDILPKNYKKLDNRLLATLLKSFNGIPDNIQGDAFGKIYEYFLGKFAMAEGQKGGEFFTPPTVVQLIVEIIEPYHGKIYDPACGSGGMFVQSADFVQRHKRNPSSELSIFGQERVAETVRLARMNLAIHGLEGDIKESNSYYEDVHKSVGKFEYVMANPPFNVNAVDKDRLAKDKRFPFGLPTTDNGNYVWISLFYSALCETGRAGFVMANSASDARHTEMEIRKKIIESSAADVMVSVDSNFFITVTLPCTLWFFDRGKPAKRRDTVLFIDARGMYEQVERARREFRPEQIEFLSNIVRLYRGEKPVTDRGSAPLMKEHFPGGKYRDIPGRCKVATKADIEAQGWSLNPGRYVGVAAAEDDGHDFHERLAELNAELEELNKEAHKLEKAIAKNVGALLG